ncbi:MAG: hypothetical protein JXQ90_19375 [Cyclobacteriaceae bacterium]
MNLANTRFIILFVSVCLSCRKDDHVMNMDCHAVTLPQSVDYEEMMEAIDIKLLEKSVKRPDSDGALERNQEGYFSVRFQLGMVRLVDYALRTNSIEALELFEQNLDYSFSHQDETGGFFLHVPNELGAAGYVPSQGDSVSAVAFFAYAVALSYNALFSSEWFLESADASSHPQMLEAYDENLKNMLNHLLERQEILRSADAEAPNRLLFDAVAIYGLGNYLDDSEAKLTGIVFLEMALDQLSPDGYFIEGGGWDSSYNGVALMIGWELWSILEESVEKEVLGSNLICAAEWQTSRISPTGEMSTEGNTRVYPGGESFLDKEKQVDVEKTIRALYYMSRLTGDDSYRQVADKVVGFYVN